MSLNEANIENIINDTAKRVIAEMSSLPQCAIDKESLQTLKKSVEFNTSEIKELDKDIRGNGKEGINQRQLRTELELKNFKETVEAFMVDVKKIGWLLVALLISLLGTSLYNIIISQGI